MKKTRVNLKISFLLTLAVLLLTATSYLSYRNLSSIVSSLQIDYVPELRLMSIRDISTDLEKADNSIRKYTISKDSIDLVPYYAVITGIGEKINLLKKESSDNRVFLEQIETIGKQIEKNITVWNEMLYIADNDSIVENISQLSAKIDSASVKSQKSQETQKKQKGFLKRIFRSREPEEKVIDEKELVQSLNKIEKQDSITRAKMKERESHLAGISIEIKEEFYDLLSKMENEASLQIKERAQAANLLAEETYKWLIIILISGSLLALLVLIIIIRYTRKTRAYQIALEKSKEETENLTRTREMFLANMSHEIRSPVTAISGFTEQLLRDTFDEEKIRMLKIVKSSADHLARIINDILDLSKLQNNKLTLENTHFSIRNILEEVYALFQPQALSNSNRLSYSLSTDTPPALFGDSYRLKQILINLIGNAIKFTNDGEVSFAVKWQKKDSDKGELLLDVIDTGIGIDENKLSIIFEDFVQAEAGTSRQYGGTGLGLSIVKKIIDLHQGTIECSSKKNFGTRITCMIPYMVGDSKKLKSVPSTLINIPEKIKDLRILIVDDQEYNRLLFKKILDNWKIRYDEAVSGKEAIEKLRENKFNLLFMDIRMPDIDGIAATDFIRNKLKISRTEMPIICISAASVNSRETDYLSLGMDAFLQKPFTEEMLKTIILEVIGNNPGAMETHAISNTGKKAFTDGKMDLRNLYHISGGDEQFVKQMLESFNFTTRKGLEEMNQALKSNEWEEIASIAHKLSAPCRHLGALDLCNLMLQIESGIRKNTGIENTGTLIGESVKEFELVSDLLNEKISKLV
jgi:signal transduction histidine kinase/CheY-like chemotaxis protein